MKDTQGHSPPSSSTSTTPNRPTFVPDPRQRFLYSRWYSVRAALAGARFTLQTQANVWIELTALAIAVLVGIWLQISAAEWAILSLVIGMVLALEAVNTAIEAVVDLVSPDYHPQAKLAKDAAAGALIFAVLASIGVGLAIFGPRLWQMVS